MGISEYSLFTAGPVTYGMVNYKPEKVCKNNYKIDFQIS